MTLATALSWLPSSWAASIESNEVTLLRQDMKGAASLLQVISVATLIASVAIVVLSLYHGGFFSYLTTPIFSVIGYLSYEFFVTSRQTSELCDQAQHFAFLNIRDRATLVRGIQNLSNRMFANTLVLKALADYAISHIQ